MVSRFQTFSAQLLHNLKIVQYSSIIRPGWEPFGGGQKRGGLEWKEGEIEREKSQWLQELSVRWTCAGGQLKAIWGWWILFSWAAEKMVIQTGSLEQLQTNFTFSDCSSQITWRISSSVSRLFLFIDWTCLFKTDHFHHTSPLDLTFQNEIWYTGVGERLHSAESGVEACPLEHPQHSPWWLPGAQPSPGRNLSLQPYYKANPILIVCIHVCICVMTDLYCAVRSATALVIQCLTYSSLI